MSRARRGFLDAAWKPLRDPASLLPATAVVILVTLLPLPGDLGQQRPVLAEATHLPVRFDATRERRPR